MDFEQFKKLFHESWDNVTPEDFVNEMINLGYKFVDIGKTKLSIAIIRDIGFDSVTQIDGTTYNYWNKYADASIDVEYVYLRHKSVDVFFKYRCLGSKTNRQTITYLQELYDLHFLLKGERLKNK